jgi:photosynthesis system II assembly factor YCF48-like protein/putative zinc finger protein
MPHPPKIVLQRLQGPTSALDHPDADLLTGFAEKSLPDSERARVTDHLARCRDCREVVALALPAIEETTVIGASARTASRTGWFLRWGVVAAGIALAAALGLLQLRQRHSTQLAYSVLQHQEVAATTSAPTSAPADHVESDRVQNGRVKKDVGGRAEQEMYVSSKTDTDRAKFAPNGAPRVPPQPSRGDNANADQAYSGPARGALGGPTGQKLAMSTPPRDLNLAQSFRSSAPAPKAPDKQLPSRSSQLPTSSETVEVTSAAPVIQAEEATVNGQAQSELALDKAQVAKAKPPVSYGDLSAAPPAAAPMEARAPAPTQSEVVEVSSAPASRWTISSSGVLQRSVNGGKTWADVNVNAESSPNTHYALMRNAPQQTETVGAKKAGSAAPEGKFTAGKTVFRAVSAAGAEVWAGGMSGILYHSSDGGDNWTRVVPAAAGVTLTGDIITIEFTDQQNGKLTTSRPEIWTTADAGQSWQKQ